MSLVRRAFAASDRRAAGEFGDSTPPPPGALSYGGDGGAGMGETAALQVLAVYGSVGVIADGVSSLPWQRFSSPDPVKRRPLPLTQILKQPYVEISRTDWLTQYAMSMALRGEFIGQVVERDQGHYPSQIKPIHPDRARVRRNQTTGRIEYTLNTKPVPIDDVLHIRYLTLPGMLRGLNPIEYLRVSLMSARAQAAYAASYFDNSANPEGVIEVEEDLDLTEVTTLLRNWMIAHQGVGRAHLPGVLTGGAKWNPISINPKDSQFLESQQYSASAISGMIFRVPPHMIGIVDRSTSWGTGIEQQERGFVTNTLGGYIGRLEEAVDGMHPDEEYCRLDLSKRLRGDKLQRYQAYALGRGGGWLSPNDIKAEEDESPIPVEEGGDTYLVPSGALLVEQALQSVKDGENAATADAARQGQNGGADA